jgi:hypothetical protein
MFGDSEGYQITPYFRVQIRSEHMAVWHPHQTYQKLTKHTTLQTDYKVDSISRFKMKLKATSKRPSFGKVAKFTRQKFHMLDYLKRQLWL